MPEKQSGKDIGRVVHVFDYNEQVVINKGEVDGVKMGDMYLLYELGEEMLDPETLQSLGRLEIVKGKGKVIHVQEKISTIESIAKTSPTKTITKRQKRNPIISAFDEGYVEEVVTGESETVPFNNPKSGDYVKFIK